jgi:hypothetical protein
MLGGVTGKNRPRERAKQRSRRRGDRLLGRINRIYRIYRMQTFKSCRRPKPLRSWVSAFSFQFSTFPFCQRTSAGAPSRVYFTICCGNSAKKLQIFSVRGDLACPHPAFSPCRLHSVNVQASQRKGAKTPRRKEDFVVANPGRQTASVCDRPKSRFVFAPLPLCVEFLMDGYGPGKRYGQRWVWLCGSMSGQPSCTHFQGSGG